MSTSEIHASVRHAPMHPYAPVDCTLRARVVAYVFDGEYSSTYTPEVPLQAVVLCPDPNAPQTVQEILVSIQPLPNLRYYAFHGGIIAYNGVLPPTFFAEVFAYVVREWVEASRMPDRSRQWGGLVTTVFPPWKESDYFACGAFMTRRLSRRKLSQQLQSVRREKRDVQTRCEELEELITDAMDLLHDLEPGMSVSAEWIADRRRFVEKVKHTQNFP